MASSKTLILMTWKTDQIEKFYDPKIMRWECPAVFKRGILLKKGLIKYFLNLNVHEGRKMGKIIFLGQSEKDFLPPQDRN